MTRTYTFGMTVTVEDDHEAYDDPEWFADAAWGVLSKLYGVPCVYSDIATFDEPLGIMDA